MYLCMSRCEAACAWVCVHACVCESVSVGVYCHVCELSGESRAILLLGCLTITSVNTECFPWCPSFLKSELPSMLRAGHLCPICFMELVLSLGWCPGPTGIPSAPWSPTFPCAGLASRIRGQPAQYKSEILGSLELRDLDLTICWCGLVVTDRKRQGSRELQNDIQSWTRAIPVSQREREE